MLDNFTQKTINKNKNEDKDKDKDKEKNVDFTLK
jgi:hypothetical protein